MMRFEREKSLVELLMRRLGLTVERYINPKEEVDDETGADVIAVVNGRRIGVQVTELDTGDEPGRSRATEKTLWRSAQEQGQGAYCQPVQNDPNKLVARIARAVASKVQHVNGCDEAWLLISAGVPEPGSVASTFLVTLGLGTDALDTATVDHLARAKYNHVFLHVIVGGKDALFTWSAGGNWQKFTRQEPVGGPTFWDVQKHFPPFP
jgi:hypothetical protein